MNISIPVTLIDNKNEVDKANSNSLKRYCCFWQLFQKGLN